MNVAVLDDQTAFREALAAALEVSGFRVTTCTGVVEDFFAGIIKESPEVALVDLRLGAVESTAAEEGFRVLQIMADRHPEISVAILSAWRGPSDVQQCYDLGASAFLWKQAAGVSEISDAVRAVAAGKRLFPTDLLSSERRRPSDRSKDLLGRLTPREREVLSYISVGDDNLKIAAHLNISERTVRAHVSGIYRKVGSENRAQLAVLARQLGLRPGR